MGTPIIPDEVLRTAFSRRAAGEKVASIARDLGLRKRYLASVLRGQDRPYLFVELGPTLGKRYLYAAELVAERTAREARRKDRLAKRRAARTPRKLAVKSGLLDDELVTGLILQWQATGDPLLFAKIIAASLELIRHVILRNGFLRFGDLELDELVNEAVLSLSRNLPRFDAGREVFPFLIDAVRYPLMRYRSKFVNAKKRYADLSPELFENCGGFYESPPELPNEFRERLADFTTHFTAPEELIAQRYIIYHLLEEKGMPSASAVLKATGIHLSVNRTRQLVSYVVQRLRIMFSEDNPVPRLFVGTSVILSGRRLQVQIGLIVILS